ncbi:MAG: alpha-amylase family glycosyl hydrolase [Leptothrix sp. (in: b-proteobacteria)]
MNQARQNEWWRGAVIYQIYPRSFQDSNGDGIGDLPGITARLDHVARLGADGIWISPFFKSPMKDFGYDVSDYRDVDPIFGTLADFDALLRRAHQLGLKVMIDQVLSHTSDQHAWFVESRSSRDNPKADWYVWAEAKADGSPPNNWLSVFGGSAWQWDTRRCQYYLHSFLTTQPDLNFHHPDVQNAVLGEVRYWCDKGVDGFRFDACNHQVHDKLLRDNPAVDRTEKVSTVRADNPYAMQKHLYDKSRPENLAFLERVRKLLDEFGAASIGEVGDEHSAPLMAQYTEAGKRLHMAYSFALLTADASARHIRSEIEKLEAELAKTGGWGCWALSNHDVPRVASRWAPGGVPQADLSRTLLTLMLTLRGSVCLYQGEELGLPEAEVPFERLQDPYGLAFWPEFKGRDGCRTPLPWQAGAGQGGFSSAEPWLPVSAPQQAIAVDTQDGVAGSVLSLSQALLAWRRTLPVLVQGAIRFLDAPPQVLLFERTLAPMPSTWDAGDAASGPARLLLAFNLSATPASLALPDGWSGAAPLAGAPWQTGAVSAGQIELPAGGTLVLGADAVAVTVTAGA